jgi:hypothetical protein
MKKCHEVDAQIEYIHRSGESVESLIGLDPKAPDRALLHAMLDEWLDNRQGGPGGDHFIVYGNWPVND